MNYINPKRLVEARLVNGYTQEELGYLLNKSKATISKWENGNVAPDTQAIITLSEKLNLPINWFTLPDFESENSLYQYRSNSNATKGLREYARIRLKWLREISSTLEEWIEFPDLNLPKSPNRLAAINLTDGDIEKYALSLRQTWQLGERPIEDLIGTAESNGIIVTREPVGLDGMDGVSCWFEDRPYIWIIADKDNYYRNRFDVAHELGHIVLHRHLLPEDCLDDKRKYKEVERQAHLFASHLLMPRRPFSLSYRSVTLDNLLIEKKHWGVSVAALIMQYYNLGIITEDYKTRLFKNYSYRKWRRNEPFDNDTTPELPRLMGNTVELLLNEGGFDKRAIIDKTNYGDSQIESLCALPEGFFNTYKSQKAPILRLI